MCIIKMKILFEVYPTLLKDIFNLNELLHWTYHVNTLDLYSFGNNGISGNWK